MIALKTNPVQKPVGASTETSTRQPAQFARAILLTAGLLLAALIVSHWPTLAHLAERWSRDPQYSHGFLVPIFALIVLWARRDLLKRVAWTPCWLGLPLLLVGVAVRMIAIQTDIEPLDAASMLPTVFGAVLLVGGWSVLNWSWPALAFLAFMLPLPFTVEVALALPLRRLATLSSTYALQTFGCPALAEGNIIYIDQIQLGVEEACSGLGMLMTFFALATAMAMVVEAPWWTRVALIVSAVPIAILANVVRISATGLAYHHAGRDSSLAQMIYHDLAGWLMMPIALGMLWVVLKLMAHLLVDEPESAPLPMLKPKQLAVPGEPPTRTT